MEGLRDFYAKHKTLSSKDSDTIAARLRHCLLHDAIAEKIMKDKQCANEQLAEEMDALLNIEAIYCGYVVRKY